MPAKRIRGTRLIWNEAKCLVCATCARTCPQGAIRMSVGIDPENSHKPVMSKFEIDTGYCIFCGLCVESCPYNALHMGYSYEQAEYRRSGLLQADQDLLASNDKQASAFMHPDKEEGLPRQTLLVEKKTALR